MLYNSLKEKPKLKKWSAFFHSLNGDYVEIGGCASLKYEIGSKEQELEFFVVPEININITLGRDWLKQFSFYMYYDLGYIRIVKSYIKMKKYIHISTLARLTTQTIIRPQTRKFCLCIAKGSNQLHKFYIPLSFFPLKTVPSTEILAC